MSLLSSDFGDFRIALGILSTWMSCSVPTSGIAVGIVLPSLLGILDWMRMMDVERDSSSSSSEGSLHGIYQHLGMTFEEDRLLSKQSAEGYSSTDLGHGPRRSWPRGGVGIPCLCI